MEARGDSATGRNVDRRPPSFSVPVRASAESKRAFTLIELLVVIAVIVLLLALLMPVLRRIRKQTQATACQARLRQWGQLFAMYLQDNNYRFPPLNGVNGAYYGGTAWMVVGVPNAQAFEELQLCPSARRPLPATVVHGSTFTPCAFPSSSKDGRLAYASYGISSYLFDLPTPYDKWFWRGSDVKGASNVPAYFDCTSYALILSDGGPPPSEGDDSSFPMSVVCINRHSEGINMLFLDWSVRKVGLKQLWTLKWHRQFDTAGPWTKTRGVKLEDWPQWMRGFKDY